LPFGAFESYQGFYSQDYLAGNDEFGFDDCTIGGLLLGVWVACCFRLASSAIYRYFLASSSAACLSLKAYSFYILVSSYLRVLSNKLLSSARKMSFVLFSKYGLVSC
jgi:hypothetical protein